ncbi:MAG: SseB family protein [Frankiales bacterium]|nr:SseB family protein [Frankiales bacterium]
MSDGTGRRFEGVVVPEPEFAGDDGSADPRLAAALAAHAEGTAAAREVLAALATARLMTPLVAVLDEEEVQGGTGLRAEKSSHMASVSLLAADGRRALLAFASVASMAGWDPDARGVPAPAARVAAAALEEGADAVMLDLVGPVPFVVEGPDLAALAHGRVHRAEADAGVRAAVARCAERVAGLLDVRAVDPAEHGEPDCDLLVLVRVEPGVDAASAADALARALLAEPVVAGAAPRGVAVGLLPDGA